MKTFRKTSLFDSVELITKDLNSRVHCWYWYNFYNKNDEHLWWTICSTISFKNPNIHPKNTGIQPKYRIYNIQEDKKSKIPYVICK